ncbi:MAG: hypothetical protein DDT35_00463 [Firmicutes bacterium]|nr:hypothetical protein [Bacillota bacterium]
MIFLLVSVFVVVVGSLWWHAMQLKVERFVVPMANLPPEFAGFTIAHLSDLHGQKIAIDGLVARSIRAAKVNAIAITGDFVTHRVDEVAAFLPFLQSMTTLAPVIAVSGNHDHDVGWEQVASRLRSAGVTVLSDEHFALRRGVAQLFIVGVRDPFSGRGDLARAMPKDTGATIVLLAHSPAYFESYAGSGRFAHEQSLLARVGLTLCGHTHGGQIKMPLVGAVTNGSKRLFPLDYVEGLSRRGKNYLYISRGLGWVIVPVRFLSRPEVAILTLQTTSA